MPHMSKTLVQYLAVAAGGSIGAVTRLLVSTVCARLFGTAFPIGTFIINITGSFFLGWFLAMASGRLMISDTLRMAIAVGFVGAYTTFSTYMYESNGLLADGATLKATANLVGSVAIGLLVVRLGIWIGAR